MQRLVTFFISHRMFVNILVLTVFIGGAVSAYNSRKEGFPEVSMNRITIETRYPGAAVSDVELNVTVPIENELLTIDGIKEILSISEEGFSIVEVRADDNATDRDFAKLFDDIDRAVQSSMDLPDNIEGRPVIREFTSSDVPVLEIGYAGEYELLKPYLDQLEVKLRRISGVGEISVAGVPDMEVQILIDPVKAKSYNVDLRMISAAVQKRNLEGSGGTLESFVGERKVVLFSKFDDYREVLNTNVIMNSDGYGIKLSQMAEVIMVPEERNLIVRNNGRRGASLTVKKTGSSDLIKTVDSIIELLNTETVPDGVEVKILFDQSGLTRNRISLLAGNALMGFALVIIILIGIFNYRTALWTAFGIPFTLFALFIFMKFIGLSINLISLGGFIIIIGMLVDDAIVISEETNTNRERGLDPAEAAKEAVKSMWMPVLASSLTTMIAFSPLFFLNGFPGKFIWAIPLMVIVGLTVSLFESFFVLPTHLAHSRSEKPVKRKVISKMENGYRKLVTYAVKKRYLVVVAAIILCIISIAALGKFAKKDPFPQEASEGFTLKLTAVPGTPASETEKEISAIEDLVAKLAREEIVGYNTRIGTHNELTTVNRGTQNNLAIMFVYLHPYSQRERSAQQIIDALQDPINKVIDSKTVVTGEIKRQGPPMGKPFEIRIISNDDDVRIAMEKKVHSFVDGIAGVYDVENDDIDGKNEVDLKIDYDILSRTGLTVEDVLSALRIAFDGQIISKMVTLDESINIRVRLDEDARTDEDFLTDLPVANRSGQIINIENFISLSEKPGRGTVRHVNGIRAVTVFGNTDLQVINPMKVMQLVKQNFQSDEQVSIEFSGQPVESALIFSGLSSAALLAFAGIYLVIVLIFNSFKRPFMVLLAIPLLVAGFAFVLLTHRIPISMMSGIAMIGLMGVVVNNSILLIHTIGAKDKPGKKTDPQKKIVDGAVSRLRPIMMSTITTVLGVLPTGYGIGGSDPFLSQMSLVLAYGLLFGAAITLVVIPVVVAISNDLPQVFARS
ncbi:MAG: efflux RND transporter permease subunit [Spirochaetes bacterium]|jgi:multidrug efflux pump subunit AcrB|nr:efflux RND transporter permease subunit [Spirochaetota bacterium]